MIELTLAPSRDHYRHDGKPFFYLADTVWAAFSNIGLDGWARYLKVRREQGFNALQISILPILHDRSIPVPEDPPFAVGADGRWDFDRPNLAYFERAETMLQMAVDQGFLPVLVMLWCCYVPDTRCVRGSPVPQPMRLDQVRPFAEFALRRFLRFRPVVMVSGDTRFESPSESPYYAAAFDGVRAVAPDAITALHLHPEGDVPAEFADRVDFLAYQSGHHIQHADRPWRLAEKFRGLGRPVPVLNSEPCYEGHGRIVPDGSRWSRAEVRKATWQSLLAGAKMGITYGAHGIWSFHRRGQRFIARDRSLEPFDWEDALALPGAVDMGFARFLYETLDLFALDPAEILLSGKPEARAAATADRRRIAIYSPSPTDLAVDLDLAGYRVTGLDLESRAAFYPAVETGPRSTILQPRANADVLILAERG